METYKLKYTGPEVDSKLEAVENKQNKLTAGNGITISEDKISVTNMTTDGTKTSFSGNVKVDGSLYVGGDIDVYKVLTVENDVYANQNLIVIGYIDARSGVIITGEPTNIFSLLNITYNTEEQKYVTSYDWDTIRDLILKYRICGFTDDNDVILNLVTFSNTYIHLLYTYNTFDEDHIANTTNYSSLILQYRNDEIIIESSSSF